MVLFFFLRFIYLFVYCLGCVFVAALGLSLVAVRWELLSSCGLGFSLEWLLLLRSTGSKLKGSVFAEC